jgi:hypothetical protein
VTIGDAVHIRGVLYGVVLLFAAAGCANASPETATGPGAAASPPAWVEPAAYKFSFESSCGERALLGRFRAEVQDGAVVRSEGLDDAGRRALMLRIADIVPTLGEMQADVEAVGGARVVIERDPVDGHPVVLSADDPDSIDEEICYRILEYTIGGTPGPQASPSR